MATFSSVTRQHVLQALEECDARGAEEFLRVYGFVPSPGYPLVHEGRSYDSKAILGVAHRFATGRLATADDFHGMHDAVALLRRRGFEVTEPVTAARPAPERPVRTRAPRTPVARPAVSRSSAAREAEPVICPTCSMTLPATGICDNCA